MTVYSINQANGFEFCYPVDDNFELVTTQINGIDRQRDWAPIPVDIVHEDEGRRLKMSDSPWLGPHALIFRPKAVEVLGSLLRENGELLPLLCSEADLMIFNATRVLDALDEEASTIMRLESGKIIWISKHVFRKELVQSVDMFKIAGMRASETFVSDRFVQRWKSEGLKGLDFKQAWSAD